MTSIDSADGAGILETLNEAERTQLESERMLRVGDTLFWVEPEGRVRREKVTRVYYVRTARGVFRYSKIDDALVEV